MLADLCGLRLAELASNGPSPDVLARATDMLNDVQASLELLDSSTTEARAATILTGLGFTEEMMNGRYSALSGGWRSRCSLATSLLVQSDVLLLDECTNFLDLEATIWQALQPHTRAAGIRVADSRYLAGSSTSSGTRPAPSSSSLTTKPSSPPSLKRQLSSAIKLSCTSKERPLRSRSKSGRRRRG